LNHCYDTEKENNNTISCFFSGSNSIARFYYQKLLPIAIADSCLRYMDFTLYVSTTGKGRIIC